MDFSTNPLCWMLILLAWALMTKKQEKRRKLLISVLVMTLFFSNPWITEKAVGCWEIPPVNKDRITIPYEAGIVLGGSMRYYDNRAKRVVYSSSVDRLMQAIDLYKSGKIRKIFLSGGSGYVNFPDWKESVFLKDVLLQCGIPDSAVIMEVNSRNTYENAVETVKVIREERLTGPFLLITSATHMRRSLACFKKAGLQPVAYSVDARSGDDMYTLDKLIKPDSENISNWDSVIHEWVGMIMYKVAGYI